MDKESAEKIACKIINDGFTKMRLRKEKEELQRIIAELVVEKSELVPELTEARSVLRQIKSACYCIGGPLNDNILNFNKEQMKWIYKNIIEPINSMVNVI